MLHGYMAIWLYGFMALWYDNIIYIQYDVHICLPSTIMFTGRLDTQVEEVRRPIGWKQRIINVFICNSCKSD